MTQRVSRNTLHSGPSARGSQRSFVETIFAAATGRQIAHADRTSFIQPLDEDPAEEMAFSPQMTEVDLHNMVGTLTSFHDTGHLLRGCPVQNVLHGVGRIFQNSEGSARTYGLSMEVSDIDAFVSHNWSVGRFLKFLVLAYHFNLRKAAIVAFLFTLAGFILTLEGYVPSFKPAGNREAGYDEEGFIGQVCIAPIYLLVLFFGHETQWLGGVGRCTTHTTFLDKTCIHQTDNHLKEQGIVKLGAFLGLSRTMVVCYTDVYLKKLWTVYEIACFLVMHPIENMTIIHTSWAIMTLIGIIFFYLNNLRYWIPIPAELNFALVLYPIALLTNFWMRHVFKEISNAKERVKKFTVREAKCYCEDDRPMVEKNVAALLKHCKYIDLNADNEEAMVFFDQMVRENLPEALEASVGTSGLPYRLLFAMVFPVLLSYVMDRHAVMIKRHGIGDRTTQLRIIMDFIDQFVVLPAITQTWAYLTSRKLWYRGWKEKAYVLAMTMFSEVALIMLSIITGYNIILPNARKSDVWIIIFVIWALIWVVYCVWMFRGGHLCQRKTTEKGMTATVRTTPTAGAMTKTKSMSSPIVGSMKKTVSMHGSPKMTTFGKTLSMGSPNLTPFRKTLSQGNKNASKSQMFWSPSDASEKDEDAERVSTIYESEDDEDDANRNSSRSDKPTPTFEDSAGVNDAGSGSKLRIAEGAPEFSSIAEISSPMIVAYRSEEDFLEEMPELTLDLVENTSKLEVEENSPEKVIQDTARIVKPAKVRAVPTVTESFSNPQPSSVWCCGKPCCDKNGSGTEQIVNEMSGQSYYDGSLQG